MSSTAAPQNVTITAGSARAIRFSLETPASVAGQTFRFRITSQRGGGTVVFTKTALAGTPVSQMSVTAATGDIDVTLLAADTAAGSYWYDLWRVDSGYEDRGAYGKIVFTL